MATKSALARPVIYTIFITVLLLLFPKCQKDDSFDQAALNDFLKNLQPISELMPAEKNAAVVSTEDETTDEYIIRTEHFEVAAGYNEQIVLNPQTDVIFPGALIKGESILDGTYTLIPARRKPITISTSLMGAGNVSVVVNDPKLSTVREAINSLMSTNFDVPPANLGFDIYQAYSEQQLALSLRASYKTGVVNVKGGFDFSNKKVKTRLVAKFIQNYYTLDMDLPNQPSDLFEGDVERSLFGTNMPMYVSSVTYGRMALFTIESELDELTVRMALQGSYGAASADFSSDFDYLEAHSTMKVYILGGSGTDAGTTINGFDEFKNYIQAGGNFSKTSPGAPISYKLRYIRDNSIGKIVFAANYPIVTAIPRTDNMFDIEARLLKFYLNITDPGSTCKLYGRVVSYKKGPLATEATGHKHWERSSSNPHILPVVGTYNFPDAIPAKKTYEGLKHNDEIMIYVRLAEVDDWPYLDDKYETLLFNVPVSRIMTSLNEQGYYDAPAFKVRDEKRSKEYILVYYRFTPRVN
jgi:thiol-activated cytolysin